MSDASQIVRRRLEAQGFLGLNDQTIQHVNYWLRLSPAICMIWAAIGTALQSAVVLWVLAPFAFLGVVLPRHPFDLLYTSGIRYMTGGASLPCYPIQRRFACLLATLMVVGAAWCFQTGHILSGQTLGWTLAAAAFVNVSTGFCIPSFIYGLIFGRPTSCELK